MANSFTSSLSLSPVSPLLFKPNSFSCPNSLLFPKNPFTTITNAKTKRIESINTITSIEEEEEEEDEDGDEEFLAFEEMRRWEMKKPSGFGEGKVYDTTVEERILEEMEKEKASKIAAEKEKMKVEDSLSKKKEHHEKKEFIPSGPTVRLANLPKKRNVHRDLQIAFKGFDGIVNITPVVSGNWKTREPICKGLAFVELVSEKAAKRFVNTYSKKDVLFGKVQKQISFEYINPEQLVTDPGELPRPNFTDSGEEISRKEFIGAPTVNETSVIETSIGHISTSYLGDDDQKESHKDVSNQKQKKQVLSMKKLTKKKSAKTSLPSSMARLKIKERTVLTGVFSKYGGKIALGSD